MDPQIMTILGLAMSLPEFCLFGEEYDVNSTEF